MSLQTLKHGHSAAAACDPARSPISNLLNGDFRNSLFGSLRCLRGVFAAFLFTATFTGAFFTAFLATAVFVAFVGAAFFLTAFFAVDFFATAGVAFTAAAFFAAQRFLRAATMAALPAALSLGLRFRFGASAGAADC